MNPRNRYNELYTDLACIWVAVILALLIFALAFAGVYKDITKFVERRKQETEAVYPEPVCERCGEPEDGIRCKCQPM